MQELTVGGLSLTSFTSGQSAIAMPQPHPSAHYERARGTDVINVTDRSRVGTVFFLTNIFVKGWGSLPTALSTTLLSTTERSGGSSLPERSVVVEQAHGGGEAKKVKRPFFGEIDREAEGRSARFFER